MNQIDKALEIALRAHMGQKDLDGKPAILHPITVGMGGSTEAEIVAGFLHDVVEDTDISFDDLISEGIDKDVVASLKLLTHNPDVPYEDYVRAIVKSGDRTALSVKTNDLRHNLKRGCAGGYWIHVAKHLRGLAIVNGEKPLQWDRILSDPQKGPCWKVRLKVELGERELSEALKEEDVSEDRYRDFFMDEAF